MTLTDRTRAYGQLVQAGTHARFGAGTGPYTSRVFDNAYRDTTGSSATVAFSTISSVTRYYTVPTGYTAFMSGACVNSTGSGINLSTFLMPDGSTPVAADRMGFSSMTANTATALSAEWVADEGYTFWAFAAATGLSLALDVLLIPKPIPGGTWTVRLDKSLAAADTAVYDMTGASHVGNWVQEVINGVVHNTTGSAITLTTKLKRQADGSAFAVWQQSVNGNTTAGFDQSAGHLRAVADAGDILYVTASATGLNMSTWWCERPTVGFP